MPREDTQFQVGHPGGPGRPKGSKNKLSESFLRALANDFEKHGEGAIERVRESHPGEYLSIIAGLMPKELLLEVNQDDSKWVINAKPLCIEEWQKQHGLDVIESPDSVRVTDNSTE